MKFTIREHISNSPFTLVARKPSVLRKLTIMFSTDKTAEVLLVAPSVLAWGTATSFPRGTVHTECDKPPYISSSWPQRLFIRMEDLIP